MIRSFLVDATVGGLVVWRWREEIQDYLASRTRGIRGRKCSSATFVGA